MPSWPSRITRYLMQELMTPTLLGLLLYTFVLLMNHFFLVAEQALSKNLGADVTFRLFVVGIPKLLVLSIPMAVLLGTLIGLGRLSADREWLALQAAGHGPAAIVRPVLLHGLLGAIACFAIYAVVVPQSHYALRSLTGELVRSAQMAGEIRPRVFTPLQDNAMVYVEDVRAGSQGRLERVLLVQPDPRSKGWTWLVVARHGEVYPAPDRSGATLVDLDEAEAHHFSSDPADKYTFYTASKLDSLRLEPPRFLKELMNAPGKSPGDLTMGELTRELDAARAERQSLLATPGGVSAGRLQISDLRIAIATVELHRRIALPLACVCFTLLALPLGLHSARSGKGAGFALSVVVVLVYRVIFVGATKQSLNGAIPAWIGPWVANAVILLWAALAFGWMRRRARGGAALPALRAWWGRRRVLESPPPEEDPAPRPSSDLAALGGTPNRFVGRLDRYVGLAFLRVLALALGSTYLIYAVFEGQEVFDRAMRTEQPLSLVGKYLAYFLPGVLPVVLPISCLIAAVVSITLLARTSELVAIRAAGISLRRVTAPLVLLSFTLSGATFLVADRIVPWTNRKARETHDLIRKVAPRTHALPATGTWRFGPDGRTLYHFSLHDSRTDLYQGLSIFTLDLETPRVVDHRFTEWARYTGHDWELGPGWFRSFEQASGRAARGRALAVEPTLTRHEEPYTMPLDITPNVAQEHRWLTGAGDELPDLMSIEELGQQISSLRNSGYDITKPLVAYHRKFAQSVSPVVMVLLGLPFAFQVGRRGSLYGIGVALLLVLLYWATFAVFNALGLETLLPPALAAWAPNLLYGLLGIYLLLYLRT